MDRRTLLRVLGGATVSIAGLPPQELTALVKATGRRVPQPREVRLLIDAIRRHSRVHHHDRPVETIRQSASG